MKGKEKLLTYQLLTILTKSEITGMFEEGRVKRELGSAVGL